MLTRRSSGADIINFPPILHCFVCFSSATVPSSQCWPAPLERKRTKEAHLRKRAGDELSVERRALPTHATTSAAGEMLLRGPLMQLMTVLRTFFVFYRGKLINFENRTDDVVVARADRSPRLFGFNYSEKKVEPPCSLVCISSTLDKRGSVAPLARPKTNPQIITPWAFRIITQMIGFLRGSKINRY